MTPAAHRSTQPRPSHSSELRAAARHFDRRRFLTVTGAAAALAFATNLPAAGTAAAAQLDAARIAEDPFTLGVASGDPLPASVLLWTRLAPKPYQPDGGLPAERVAVHWELAHDERFRRVVRRGTATAHPEFHHTVHVEVGYLDPGRVYYYRFRTGAWISETGRTRTAPGRGHLGTNTGISFAAVSCQRYDQGYYTAYRHLADEDVDVVFHLGDYLYEYAVNSVGGARNYTDRVLPDLLNHETVTLEDYRLHYALYKTDLDLRAAHAAHPFVVTWDDHETENNYAGDLPDGSDTPPEEFLLRRAAAYRAYWENQPLRTPQKPDGPDMKLYRRFQWGRLAQFDILDTRQYRSNQAYGDGWQTPGPESADPARTMTGATQERWLLDGWAKSDAVWNVVPQQVTFSQRRNAVGDNYKVSMDSWDGYTASRERVLAGADAAGIENLMVLTGDVHVGYAFDIKRDFDDRSSRTVGTELVATSISSGGNGSDKPANWDTYMTANPHMRFYNGRRGYVLVALGRQQARADFMAVPYVTTPGAGISTVASFALEAGKPGLTPV
ncbi:alkaline phosphatase D family protein [Streptomyces ipomoeae]|uniref:Tat pathway signal sequence domain protein n=1 Tax=Streptomyces ipomoeae 91-03 TaxID=698759 RepID=L1KSN2_9ACTN|nr:alkaline phosphatase D family protein [Streptomyces ipomoeae]EKX63485.1 Tat pathway signal sequence domain protein [Streptomyces ipomoeae 91-03]MDX2695988.1 alkaline phosphatase D family protein [Streptomyces ipomoeae]MDX2822241.1 alkaline phosphatase D family protein [Streptomyces ipomoeae]MDX2841996.1 alkaline phosphatase D family protein [Streptomyces ipomoeae]MDX2874098.1 alkaline phosphatase D family protein [Streptomyces ipomoeae]